MADRFNLPELKDLAAAKFGECASHWPQHDFATIVSAVVDSTPSNDRGLRPIVAETCVLHIHELLGIKIPERMLSVDSKEWEKILIKDGDFLYSILRQNTAKTHDYQERLGAEIAQLVAEVVEQKEAAEQGKIRVLSLITASILWPFRANACMQLWKRRMRRIEGTRRISLSSMRCFRPRCEAIAVTVKPFSNLISNLSPTL